MASEDVSKETMSELRVRLYESKQALDRERKVRLELQVKLKETLALIESYEYKLAEIIGGGVSESGIDEVLLKDLALSRKEALFVSQQFEDLSEYVLSSYKLLKVEQAVIDRFNAKAALLRERLALLLTAGKVQERPSGVVIDVNEDLAVVAIDLGYGDGVTQGSEWQVEGTSSKSVSIKIVEVSRSLSLGVMLTGKLQDVPRGATVVRKKEY
jgi:hypothetical protein